MRVLIVLILFFANSDFAFAETYYEWTCIAGIPGIRMEGEAFGHCVSGPRRQVCGYTLGPGTLSGPLYGRWGSHGYGWNVNSATAYSRARQEAKGACQQAADRYGYNGTLCRISQCWITRT